MSKTLNILFCLILLASCGEAFLGPEEQTVAITDSGRETVQEEISLITVPKRIAFDSFERAIPIPAVTPSLGAVYNDTATGDYIAEYTQPDMIDTLDGFVTDNSAFYTQVLAPAITPRLDSLLLLQKYQMINALTLFIYESYQDFIGLSFYRWGGDITDRDQPQVLGHTRSDKRYGMDCSGFGASPYEAAVLLGLLDSTDTESAFAWFGFRHICRTDEAISDGGGRSGSTNNFRLEVSDMAKVGELITTIASGTRPTEAQMELMQAGDVVIKSGHMGILVEINEELYFLESGGSTVNEEGLYTPYLAIDALEDFAGSRTTTIRRCLPQKETSTGIVRY